jgi:hypothetical protein
MAYQTKTVGGREKIKVDNTWYDAKPSLMEQERAKQGLAPSTLSNAGERARLEMLQSGPRPELEGGPQPNANLTMDTTTTDVFGEGGYVPPQMPEVNLMDEEPLSFAVPNAMPAMQPSGVSRRSETAAQSMIGTLKNVGTKLQSFAATNDFFAPFSGTTRRPPLGGINSTSPWSFSR